MLRRKGDLCSCKCGACGEVSFLGQVCPAAGSPAGWGTTRRSTEAAGGQLSGTAVGTGSKATWAGGQVPRRREEIPPQPVATSQELEGDPLRVKQNKKQNKKNSDTSLTI